ncbi:LV321 protein, partial [Amia calva]|nr:LV321 protein [Amia calva]
MFECTSNSTEPVLFFVTVAEAEITLKQERMTLTRSKTKTARIRCKLSGTDFGSAYIHWYQQKEGHALNRILYIADATPVYDQDSNKPFFTAEKDTNAKESTLIVRNLDTSHSATYYCACWDSHSDTEYICILHKNHSQSNLIKGAPENIL